MNAKPETIDRLRQLILKSEGEVCDGVNECGCEAPITLPRVLMALGKKPECYGSFKIGYGMMQLIMFDNRPLITWNLYFDVDCQTEETLLSIIKILEV